jgi:hypothetical protein
MDVPEVWPGVLDEVPEVIRPLVTEPAFCDENGVPVATCCLWRRAEGTAWRTGGVDHPEESDGDPDGADFLFEPLADRSPETYAAWASDHYETPVGVAAVRAVLDSRPLTPELVAALDPRAGAADPESLAEEAPAIGYPVLSRGRTRCPRRPA